MNYIEAHNEHQVQEVLSFFHREISFEIANVWETTGIDQMRELEQWDSALNSNLTMNVRAVNQNRVICSIQEKNDWFNATISQ